MPIDFPSNFVALCLNDFCLIYNVHPTWPIVVKKIDVATTVMGTTRFTSCWNRHAFYPAVLLANFQPTVPSHKTSGTKYLKVMSDRVSQIWCVPQYIYIFKTASITLACSPTGKDIAPFSGICQLLFMVDGCLYCQEHNIHFISAGSCRASLV